MAPKTAARHIEGLPYSVVGPVDLGRLMRELDNLDNQLQSARLRASGEELKMPKTSHILDEVASLNKLNLLLDDDRTVLRDFLSTVKASAPRIHMSFSADPSPLFIEKVMNWLRSELHPAILLTIGLQPGIGAGCVVRTSNKYFDMSLSRDFSKNRELLMSSLRAMPDVAQQPAAVVAASAPVSPAAVQQPVRATAPHATEVHA